MSPKEKADTAGIPPEGNRLINGLPARQRIDVLARCDRVELAFDSVLCEAGLPFEYAYFPVNGNISLVNAFDDHQPFETESIGSEGMLGLALILDINRASQQGIVQTPCQALRIGAGDLQAALIDYPALLPILQRYLYVVVAELLQSAGCLRFHDAGKRLARGLLLAHDRAGTDKLPLTHLLLADRLGVQRGAVTIAAIRLQRTGIIRYRRGKISVIDRPGLEAASCGCYRASIDHYNSMFP
ncbi:Crp/Fnr family transcriptional regulator [Marinobacter salicampi]|uniref:Crp/Fnr family transcriptional regulator n=1 Tax=Marinobacter salicampi TaxID=435907 RepID=UPI0014099DDA|nr:Crp/Fnr family transcriptional regulator [Marinobacter salicampi]